MLITFAQLAQMKLMYYKEGWSFSQWAKVLAVLSHGYFLSTHRIEVSPALSRQLEKSVLILGKNALITVIYGWNSPFKKQFLRVSWKKKTRRFFSAGPNSMKTPLPLKIPGCAPALPSLDGFNRLITCDFCSNTYIWLLGIFSLKV